MPNRKKGPRPALKWLKKTHTLDTSFNVTEGIVEQRLSGLTTTLILLLHIRKNYYFREIIKHFPAWHTNYDMEGLQIPVLVRIFVQIAEKAKINR